MPAFIVRWLARPSAADAARSATEAYEVNTAKASALAEAFRNLSQSMAAGTGRR